MPLIEKNVCTCNTKVYRNCKHRLIFSHFISLRCLLIQGSGPSDAAQAQVDGILKKLEMNLPGSKVKNMGGGVVIDLEHNDDYG